MSLIPSNQTIYGNLAVAGSITSFTNQVPTDPFGDIRVVQKASILDLKSTFGISALRDIVETTGSGAVANTVVGLGGTGEYHMSVSAANDTALLQSTERGSYVAGFGAEVGLGIRIPASPTGTTVARWGYFDSLNGMFFQVSSAGMAVGMRRGGGADTVVPRASWNVDKLDGTGPSGHTLDLARGNVFQIVFSWYGFGALVFRVVVTDSTGNQCVQVVHRSVVPNSTSMTTPNLPVSVAVTQGATAAAFSVFVAGRQYSLIGNFPRLTYRVSTAYVIAGGGVTKTAFSPILSVRRKNGYLGNAIRIHNIDIFTASECYFEVRVNATRGGVASSWVNLPSTVAAETALEQDTSATTVTGGIVLYAGFLPGSLTDPARTAPDDVTFIIDEFSVITLCVRGGPGGANSAVCTAHMRFKESW